MTLTPLGRAVAERGKHWLAPADTPAAPFDLSGDSLEGSTPAEVRSSTIAALHKHLGDHYTRRPGIAPLCVAVATALAEADIAVDADKDVVIAGGAQEARFVALRALAPGLAVYLPLPAPLEHYRTAVAFAGGELRSFAPDGELPEAQGGLLLIANPNPATGQTYERATLGRLAQWASDAGLTIITDETAAPLLRPGVALTHIAALPGMAERTLTLGSFAGTPGLAAWQVAWFAGARALVTKVRDLKQAMTICSPAAGQYAALAGSQLSAVPEPRQLDQLQKLAALLERYDIPYLEPHTYAYVVADVAALGGGDKVADLAATLGVRVQPGSAFGTPERIRINASGAQFGQALAALDVVFAQLTRGEAQQ